ncbi:hypothetical protein BsWGS_10691 [Bradybaena similaris]
MRLHLRRMVITLFILIISIYVFYTVYSYGSKHFWKLRRKRIPSIANRDVSLTVWNAGSMFWDGNIGVRKLPPGMTSVSQNSVLRFGFVQAELVDETFKVQNNLTMEERRNFLDKELLMAELVKYNMNIHQSDRIPLNRDVPDSRPQGCDSIEYPDKLPTTSVVVPFHNEWISVVIRTVYSLINRTPKHLLKEIILVDDASDIDILKVRLKSFVEQNFPQGLVKLIRLEQRQGLIRARMEGLKYATGEAVSFFDSHMEVNIDWLQPLLAEIVKNNQTIAMGQLDYIHRDTFNYNYFDDYRTRYGFRWDMQFFETYFRRDQLRGKKETDSLPGVLMVGPGFVVDTNYFKNIGAYDSDMLIWGGENIELAWRVWMCGGQLVHVPCSRIGHIERVQPYNFPKGRQLTEMHNYKRAVDVWLGDYKKYVYNLFPGMKDLDAGDLSQRFAIKDRLKCQDFPWFIKHIWPELLAYQEDSQVWGQVRAQGDNNLCLDNGNYVFQAPKLLELKTCTQDLQTQGFGISHNGTLRTTIHCVVAIEKGADVLPFVENCFLKQMQVWRHNEHQQLVHVKSDLCLQMMNSQALTLQSCVPDLISQKWLFQSEGLLEVNN